MAKCTVPTALTTARNRKTKTGTGTGTKDEEELSEEDKKK